MIRSYKEFCEALWRDLVSIKSEGYTIDSIEPEDTKNIREHWLPFLKLQLTNLVQGGLRYGRICDPYKVQYDRMESILKRVKEYKKSGNDELLVDIANMAFLEYTEGVHPKKHWSPVSAEDQEHTKENI